MLSPSASSRCALLLAAIACLCCCNAVFGLEDRPGRAHAGSAGDGAGAASGGGGSGGVAAWGGAAGQGGHGGHGGQTSTGGSAGSGGDGGSGGQPVSRVFVTSQSYTGNLGGLSGADAKCVNTAASASLGGNWRAWLSAAGTNARDRIDDVAPWHLVTGELVFDSHVQLVTGPDVTISRTENGTQITGDEDVWTGTLVGGGAAASHCSSWGTGSSVTAGRVGSAFSVAAAWTDWSSLSCGQLSRLYCFEQ